MKYSISKPEKQILNRIQSGFPITTAPFTRLSEELELPESLILNRISKLKRQKLIRRFGAVFNSQTLGFKSLLCGVKLDPKLLDKVGKKIAEYQAVTHCYARNHIYNLGFTLTGRTEKDNKSVISEIKKMRGVQDILVLPAVKTVKIRTEFKLE
jgi:siroheme decarboxylase